MIHVTYTAAFATMLPFARPFRPFRNVYLTWSRPRIPFLFFARASRSGQPLAAQGPKGGYCFHSQPLEEEEEVPEEEEAEGEEEVPEEEEAKGEEEVPVPEEEEAKGWEEVPVPEEEEDKGEEEVPKEDSLE